MAEIVTMPKLGFDMAEGTLVKWVVQEGEKIEKGAVLAEIETDKATVEVESNYEGVVARHLVEAGAVVPVNMPIAVIAAPGEDVEKAAQSAGKAEGAPPKPEATPVEKAEAASPAPAPAAQAEAPEGSHLPEGLRASPIARRMATEARINLGQVAGSGPGGRIVKRDIVEYLQSPARYQEAAAPALKAEPARPSIEKATKPTAPLAPLAPLPTAETPADEILPLNRLRAAIGRRMTEAKQQAPHFYVTHEYDVDSLVALRQQVNSMLSDEEKVSVNDFIVKGVALALRQFPNLNASLGENQVIRHGAVNIGVAVAVEGGLLTVVCRDADRKPLRQIAVEVRTMASRAREGKVRPEDIEGSTFSISNLGMYDVENFSAIINPPEAAILAVGTARQVPVVKEGGLAVGWRMKATLSVDHRVSDGAEAARFLQALALYLEGPLSLLL
ncbi:MAG: 2-oxo acid dehydrogenase subunit E2 [Anaerolineales bacterium]|nr:2-oxo acid dehydrogenase subunit E2 [Anaerolineales bacterium]